MTESYIVIEPEKVIELCKQTIKSTQEEYEKGIEEDALKIYQEKNASKILGIFSRKFTIEKAREEAKTSLMENLRDMWRMEARRKVFKIQKLAEFARQEAKEVHLTVTDYNLIR